MSTEIQHRYSTKTQPTFRILNIKIWITFGLKSPSTPIGLHYPLKRDASTGHRQASLTMCCHVWSQQIIDQNGQ